MASNGCVRSDCDYKKCLFYEDAREYGYKCTLRGELFVAIYIKTTYRKDYKDEHEWFSYGTGGRRMKVMSKVVAWMDLTEKYEGE